MNDSLLEKLSHGFVQQSVRNVCAKFKIYRLRCFCTGVRHVLTTQKRFPGKRKQNSSVHEICKIKFPLNTFSDHFLIKLSTVKFPLGIFDIKQIYSRAKK